MSLPISGPSILSPLHGSGAGINYGRQAMASSSATPQLDPMSFSQAGTDQQIELLRNEQQQLETDVANLPADTGITPAAAKTILIKVSGFIKISRDFSQDH